MTAENYLVPLENMEDSAKNVKRKLNIYRKRGGAMFNRKKWQKTYNKKNKEKLKELWKTYYIKNRRKKLLYAKQRRLKLKNNIIKYLKKYNK